VKDFCGEVFSVPWSRRLSRFNLNSEIETTDSADFTDFEEVIEIEDDF
jgi:hypothetical protein